MLEKLSLRLRIFLIFAGLEAGILAGIGLGLWMGVRRLSGVERAAIDLTGGNVSSAMSGLVTAGALAAFVSFALVAWVWYLFDQNVARPLDTLAGGLRADAAPDAHEGRYLGDVIHAARARLGMSAPIGMTEHLMRDRDMLEAALMVSEDAVLISDAEGRVVLYNPAAAETLPNLALDRPLDEVLGERRPKRREEVMGGAELIALDRKPGGEFCRLPQCVAYDFTETRPRGAPAKIPLSSLDCVVFDLETTGLTPQDDIVQIGAIRVLRGRVVAAETFDILVDPGRPIPPGSTKVHGISNEMVRGAPNVMQALTRLKAFCGSAVLVAHNAPFDMGFLRRGPGPAFDNPVLDTVLLSAMVWGQAAPHSLDALTERLGITIPAALRHTALGDARATAAAFVRLIPALEGKGITTLAEVTAEARRHKRLQSDANTAVGGAAEAPPTPEAERADTLS